MLRNLLLSLSVTGAVLAQDPGTMRVAFAADPGSSGPGGIAWLRHEILASRPEWPAGQDPDAAFTLHVDAKGLRVQPALPLPTGAYAAGEEIGRAHV